MFWVRPGVRGALCVSLPVWRRASKRRVGLRGGWSAGLVGRRASWGSGSVVCGCAAPGRLRSWRWWRMRGPPSFSRKAFDGADGGQRVNEEIARLARLAARPGHQLPLFAALTVAVEDERELSRGGVIDGS